MRDVREYQYGDGVAANHKLMTLIAKRDQGWKCHYCRQKLIHIRNKRHKLLYGFCYHDMVDNQQNALWPTLDHVRPKAKSGKNNMRNLVLACHDCNRRKGSRYSYREFLNIIQAERARQNGNKNRRKHH